MPFQSIARAARNARFVRGLRFRLTLSQLVFFSLLLTTLGIVFRVALNTIQQNQIEQTLEDEWGAAKAFLHFDNKAERWSWTYDTSDEEESYIQARIRQIFLFTDSSGGPASFESDTYQSLKLDSPQFIHTELETIRRTKTPILKVARDEEGVPYMIRSGLVFDDRHREYYMAIGRSLSDKQRVLDQFTRYYFLALPLVIAFSTLLGWLMAGPALRPVNDVARTALRITSSNLGLQIPPRGAGDELDHLIRAFNRMSERLKNSFEQTRRFSTDVSHELRTPLTAIRGQLEVALLTAKTPEQLREAMENALEDVERLSSIVRALLMLSQAESGQLLLHRSIVNLSTLIEDVVDQFQIPAEGAQVRLSAECPPACPVDGDRVQLERLLSNLLSNAIKYTPAGGSVHVRASVAGDWVKLLVEDTGQGIPPDHLPHIFDRFYRVPDPNPEKGLGLGLSFVAWIVKAHGGSVEVDSKVGRGTQFLVSLPKGEVPAPNDVPIAEHFPAQR